MYEITLLKEFCATRILIWQELHGCSRDSHAKGKNSNLVLVYNVMAMMAKAYGSYLGCSIYILIDLLAICRLEFE